MKILSQIMPFVFSTVKHYHIDESHAVGHALDVFYNSHQNIQWSLYKEPQLNLQRNIIYTSALVHDLCDDKYTPVEEALKRIQSHLSTNAILNDTEITAVSDIISTMSYSKVKKSGYPDLGIYQYAYNIVRESDLLAAYNPERSLIYNYHNVNRSWSQCVKNANDLFENRVWRHDDDGLFLTEYSRFIYRQYDQESRKRMMVWKRGIHPPTPL